MKHKNNLLIVAIFVIISASFCGSKIVKAVGDYTDKEMTLTEMTNMEGKVYSDHYIDNILEINNTLTDNRHGDQAYKFTLKEDGFVSLHLSSNGMQKVTTRNGKTTSTDATITATIYRDKGYKYPVAPPIKATGRVPGESPNRIALDMGTYYVGIHSTEYYSDNNTAINQVFGKAELIVYYQPVSNNEVFRPSSQGKENELKMETEFKGFLTATNPKDYYKFKLNDKALVKFNCMYGSTNPMKFTLYSSEREELLSKLINGKDVWYNVEKFLEPGTYYCTLETTTTNTIDGGVTRLLFNQTIYPLVLKQKNSTTNSYVTVDTIDNPAEIRFVLGKLTNSELTSPKWTKGKVITDTRQFGVNKVGDYTVRVTDEYGNMFMQSIRVTSCDNKAPKKPTVKSYKAGDFTIKGTAEKNALVTVTVNGRAFTCNANSKGNYSCSLPFVLRTNDKIEVTAQDISGNVSSKAEVAVK